MHNKIIAALAATALLALCACQTPAVPEAPLDVPSASAHGETEALSAATDAANESGSESAAATDAESASQSGDERASNGNGAASGSDDRTPDDASARADQPADFADANASSAAAPEDATSPSGSPDGTNAAPSSPSDPLSSPDGTNPGSPDALLPQPDSTRGTDFPASQPGTMIPQTDAPSSHQEDSKPKNDQPSQPDSSAPSQSGREQPDTTGAPDDAIPAQSDSSRDQSDSKDAQTPASPMSGDELSVHPDTPEDTEQSPSTGAPGDGGDDATEAVTEPAEPAPSYPLKGRQSAPAEANDHSVPRSEIVEGAGPLGSAEIYIGPDDFMFYGECIKDLVGNDLLSDSVLNRFARIMNERDEWAAQNGMKLIFVIAPNKATVYNDYVPSSVTQSGYTRCDQVVECLAEKTSVTFLDLRQTLKDARAEYGDELFYRYDTHWNQNGGFVAYQAIMDEVKKTQPSAVKYGKDDFNVDWYETYMKDNAWYLGWYDSFLDYGPVYSLKAGPDAKLMTKSRNGSVGGQYALAYQWPNGYRDDLTYLYYKSKNTGASSVYMYQDSFGIGLMPFMKESFAEASFEWSYQLSKRDILEMEVDTLIIEVSEKGLGDFVKLRAFY